MNGSEGVMVAREPRQRPQAPVSGRINETATHAMAIAERFDTNLDRLQNMVDKLLGSDPEVAPMFNKMTENAPMSDCSRLEHEVNRLDRYQERFNELLNRLAVL